MDVGRYVLTVIRMLSTHLYGTEKEMTETEYTDWKCPTCGDEHRIPTKHLKLYVALEELKHQVEIS